MKNKSSTYPFTSNDIKTYLDDHSRRYNSASFIEEDPISIPHRFSLLQDIEISAFFAAIFSWGRRATIIQKASELLKRMGNAPYEFIRNSSERDLLVLDSFVHRTFNSTDLLYFVSFFKWYYTRHESLEDAFTCHLSPDDLDVESALSGFHKLFFSLTYVPERTYKHVSTPEKGSSCKRLNMFLRWMVRRDDNAVDFGLWENISPSQLCIPLDVHVGRIARHLGLLDRKQNDWKAVIELSEKLRSFDSADPCKYDFALFGLSIMPNQYD